MRRTRSPKELADLAAAETTLRSRERPPRPGSVSEVPDRAYLRWLEWDSTASTRDELDAAFAERYLPYLLR